jgi:hypothetical protein
MRRDALHDDFDDMLLGENLQVLVVCLRIHVGMGRIRPQPSLLVDVLVPKLRESQNLGGKIQTTNIHHID